MLTKFFSAQWMSKKITPQGEMPDTKELYGGFFKVAWPAMVESVLMSLVNLIDTKMVSVLGSGAVAAVGLTTQPRMIFFAVFFAMNVAVTAIVARRKGQNDREGANASLAQALSLVMVLSVVLCGAAVFCAEPLLLFAGAKPDTIGDASIYFRITMIGLIFTSIGMVINAAQRGCGNTKISMRTNIVANVTNICLNYCLISGHLFFPALGVKGAAIATVAGNIASFSMSLWSLHNKNGFLQFSFRRLFQWKANLISTIAKISLGAGTEQIFMRVGFFAYAKMVAELGTAEFATHTICMNIITISFACGDGLSVAASTLVGQNLGRRRADIATLYGKTGQRVGLIFSGLLVLIFVFAGNMMVSMFTSVNDENYSYIVYAGTLIMYLMAVVTPAQISQVIYNGVLRGAGDTKYVAITSAITIAFIRPVLTYLMCFPLGWGLYGAWISLVVDQYLRLILSYNRFSNGKWSRVEI